MQLLKAIGLAMALILAMPAYSAIETHTFDTPEQEALFKKMTEELRCLVCQNQNLADSNADLAKDLREKTYEMVKAGNTEKEIVEFMVARYGDFVLYRPPVKSTTWALWIGPVIFLVIAILIAFRFVRGREEPGTDPDINDEQLRKARELLEKDKEKDES